MPEKPRKLLILSDIHGNWPALEAVLEAEPDFDAVAFCGDVMDYGPCPVECLHWLRDHATWMVRGNHDNALAFNLDCQCPKGLRELSMATRVWHSAILSDDDWVFLRQLLTLNCFEWEGKHFRLAHATPEGGLFEYLPMSRWEQLANSQLGDFILLGHTHIQGLRTFGKTTIVNPGSVGLARDGGGEACYAVMEGNGVGLMRVPYDVDRTIALLQQSPLPEHVVHDLTHALRGVHPRVDSSSVNIQERATLAEPIDVKTWDK